MAIYFVKESQFPLPFFLIMADNICCVVIADNFEISVIRGKPAIKNFYNLNFPRSHKDVFWGFLSPISTIAVDFNLHDASCQYEATETSCFRMHRNARIYDKTEQTKIVEIPELIAI